MITVDVYFRNSIRPGTGWSVVVPVEILIIALEHLVVLVYLERLRLYQITNRRLSVVCLFNGRKLNRRVSNILLLRRMWDSSHLVLSSHHRNHLSHHLFFR
jgi:hypothetical protein